MLYKSQKQKSTFQNINSTLHTNIRTGFPRSCRFFSLSITPQIYKNTLVSYRSCYLYPTKVFFIGGAAGYCLRVRKISIYAIYEHSLFFYLGYLEKLE